MLHLKLLTSITIIAILIHIIGYNGYFNTISSHVYIISQIFKNIYYLVAVLITGITIFAPCISKYFYSSNFDEFVTDVPKVARGVKIPNSIKAREEEKNIIELIRKYIVSQQNWQCARCRQLLDYSFEIDHQIPLSQGGTNKADNLQALCPKCHILKKTQDKMRYK